MLYNFFFVGFRHGFFPLTVVCELVDVLIYLAYVNFVLSCIAVLCFCMLWLCMKLYIRVY